MVTEHHIDQAIEFIEDLNDDLRIEEFIESFGDSESAVFGFLVDQGEILDNDEAFEILLDLGALTYKSFLFAGRDKDKTVLIQDVQTHYESAVQFKDDIEMHLEEEEEEALLNLFSDHPESTLIQFLMEESFSEETNKLDISQRVLLFICLLTVVRCFSEK